LAAATARPQAHRRVTPFDVDQVTASLDQIEIYFARGQMAILTEPK
jgi:hypothetical protein